MSAASATQTEPFIKPYKGMGMEGMIARWYAKTTFRDLPDFRREAVRVASQLKSGASVLEVAPGPGYFAIELARAGDFRIAGLDISRTLVALARQSAQDQSVKVDFQQGNASAMPFESGAFDFIFCRAAFKNFSQPLEAINEMHRVLRPGGMAQIVDLRRDVSMADIDSYIKQSGRSFFDSLITKLAFQTFLIRRAYSSQDFQRMAAQSRFGACRVVAENIGFTIYFTKS